METWKIILAGYVKVTLKIWVLFKKEKKLGLF